MLTLNDLQALDDAAFNRAIAEAAGWRVVEFHEDWDDHFGGVYGTRSTWYAYVAPGEERPRHRALRALTPFGAWENALHYGGDEWASVRIPDYAHDLNAAWTLCAALPMAVVDVRFFAAQRGGYVQISPCDGLQIDFEGQPARALATAWYAWLLDQRERKE